MNLDEIRNHWNQWAESYGTSIRATEKSNTRKSLEIDSLIRSIKNAGFLEDSQFSILEAGSGTGHNCLELAQRFPNAQIIGFDYIPEMIRNANVLKKNLGITNIQYFEIDLLNLQTQRLPLPSFDIVFTNRCLINLNSHILQNSAAVSLSTLVAKNGSLILGENPQHKFDLQNQMRVKLGLEERTPPEFNLLVDEIGLVQALESAFFTLTEVDDFSSLHDILLYVLLPALNGGVIDYEDPILDIASNLSIKVLSTHHNAFGVFGQNRMYRFIRRA
jgi:SAM-dependent methyltransferase